MPVNSLRHNFTRQGPATQSGQRLYLRDEELDNGLELIFSARDTIKAHTLEALHSGKLQGENLNWSQTRLLALLLRRPQGVLALAQQLGLTKQATIKTLDDIEQRGWIARHDDPKDGRRRTISLTPTGIQIAQEIAATMRHILAQAYKQSGGDAVAGCDTVLTALCTLPAPISARSSEVEGPAR
jgi:DNA-binding MarR family transcriptional regulator